MIRRNLFLATLAFCVGTAAVAQEATTPPIAPPAAPPVAGPGMPPSPPPPPPTTSQERGVQLSGKVARFLVNPNGEVDGFLLDDHTQVGFPPHMGSALTAKVKAGDRVTIDGFRIGTLPLVRASSIGARNGERLVDTPPTTPPPPPAPPALQPMDAQGRVTQALYGPQGEVNGVVLDSGPIVRVPPPAALDNALFRPGASLSAKGFGIDSPYGRAIQATAIGPRPGAEQPLANPPRPGDVPPPPPAPPGAGNAVGMVPPPPAR